MIKRREGVFHLTGVGQLDLTKCPWLQSIGACCVCGTKLSPLPDGAFDDRMFCSNDCALIPMVPQGRVS